VSHHHWHGGDDGIGMPPKRREGSLGLRLIEMFAQQIKGKAVMEGRSGGDGTMVVVTSPPPTTRCTERWVIFEQYRPPNRCYGKRAPARAEPLKRFYGKCRLNHE